MKALLIAESREGKLLPAIYELIAFAKLTGVEYSLFLVGDKGNLPKEEVKLFFADQATYGEYNPKAHKALIVEAANQAGADQVIFSHSSYGWDLAPRIAFALEAGQVSEVSGLKDGKLEVGCYNAKLRKSINPTSTKSVLTLQAGAFTGEEGSGSPEVIEISTEQTAEITFKGFETPAAGGMDLTKAEVIVSVGRGVGKKENVEAVQALADALKGELGCSRPVADNQWVDQSRQVGTTGQTVAPKLYVACGISGAIQHLAGMKAAEFTVAINKDKDAPISEVADVFVVADLNEFIPILTSKLNG